MGSEWDEGFCTAITTAGTTPITLWAEVKLGIPEGRKVARDCQAARREVGMNVVLVSAQKVWYNTTTQCYLSLVHPLEMTGERTTTTATSMITRITKLGHGCSDWDSKEQALMLVPRRLWRWPMGDFVVQRIGAHVFRVSWVLLLM